MENSDKQALIETIERLVESDPHASPTPLALLHLLEFEDLVAIEQSLLKSKANRSEENDKWFDELCRK
ncbi:MAG: hypothetical protein KBE05_02440 [Sulfurospirillum sp.]|nr:hypothetical protein [Sulfurospirillum sp.]